MQLKIESEWAETLQVFFEKMRTDNRICPTHISLYLALLHEANKKGSTVFHTPVEIIMENAKISSKVTYGRRLRELHAYGYIDYQPSFMGGKSMVDIMVPGTGRKTIGPE